MVDETMKSAAGAGDGVPRYMSVPEAAEYVRVSMSYLRKATRQGDVACARLGNRVVYDRRELDSWVERNTRRRQSVRASEVPETRFSDESWRHS